MEKIQWKSKLPQRQVARLRYSHPGVREDAIRQIESAVVLHLDAGWRALKWQLKQVAHGHFKAWDWGRDVVAAIVHGED